MAYLAPAQVEAFQLWIVRQMERFYECISVHLIWSISDIDKISIEEGGEAKGRLIEQIEHRIEIWRTVVKDETVKDKGNDFKWGKGGRLVGCVIEMTIIQY